jgi:predicted Zn finger-like uncharacterized protein
MSLATRCVSCGTVFRVVQDQLKVSEGWVRCGRCGDVFNALEGLFDLDRESAPSWTPSQRGALDLLPGSADEHLAQEAAGGSAAEPAVVLGEPPAEGEALPPQDTEIDTRADSRAGTGLQELDALDREDRARYASPSEFGVPAAGDAPAATAEAEPIPAFMQQADKAARWQRPGMRLALAAAAVLLGLLLAAQAALLQRDAIAARWPQATPMLSALCAPIDCRIEPLRRLDGLAVENSGLTQLDNASLYRLQVLLRNRDAVPLLTPALDVTLTDSRGDVVARKVLGVRDFASTTPVQVAAGSELSLQAVLDAGERRVTGYSIEIFYP